MNIEDTSAVVSCENINPGDEITASIKGRIMHRGTVTETMPAMQLFWISDLEVGGRKLIELSEYDVCRASDSDVQSPHRTDTLCPENLAQGR